MTRNALIVLIGVALFCKSGCFSAYVNTASDAAAAPAPAPVVPAPAVSQIGAKSVFHEMYLDNQVCEDSKLLYGSKFTKSCNEVNYPTNNITLNRQNVQQFLCLGIYDRIMNLCHLNSLNGIQESLLPVNAAVFDAEIEKLFPKDQDQDIDYCKEWKNPYSSGYQKINPYVTQLEEVLKQPVKCIKLCTDANDRFTDLCTVLVFMDKLAEQYKLRLDTLIQKQQAQEIGVRIVPGGAVNAVKQINTKVAPKEINETPEKSVKLSQHLPPVSTNDKPVIEKSKESPSKLQNQEQSPQDHKQPAEIPPLGDLSAPGNSPPIQSQIPEQEKDTKKSQPVVSQKSEQSRKPNHSSTVLNAKGEDPTASGNIPSEIEDGALKQNGPVAETDETANQLDNTVNSDIIPQNSDDQDIDEGADLPANANSEIDRPKTLQEEDAVQSPPEPSDQRDYVRPIPNIRNDDDSHFFSYFTIIGVMCVAGYIGYNYKQKILAMVLEGRRSRGGRGRRRPSTVNYRKLDCTLEEAVTSQCNSNVTHVIY